MATPKHTRFVLSPSHERTLPLFVETVGTMPDEVRMTRDEGYPYYHWLQTAEGTGRFHVFGQSFELPPCSGLLLPPHVPHAYEPVEGKWGTVYLTFGGSAVQGMLLALGLPEGRPVHWEPDAPVATTLSDMLDTMAGRSDLFGLHASSDAYLFLLLMSQFGKPDKSSSVVRFASKLDALVAWLEDHYADPAIGLPEMLDILAMPSSTANDWFRRTFHQSPYSYLLDYRIRKAKETLFSKPNDTVKSVAAQVGFRDVSHFVATFRKKTGFSPDRYRQLYK